MVLAPIGFVCDHVEILYDVDILFRRYAAERGIALCRPESLNDSPSFTAPGRWPRWPGGAWRAPRSHRRRRHFRASPPPTTWPRRGIASTIIESRPRLGGVIQTVRVEGCVIEAGPDSFLSVKPAAMDLIRELGLADEVIGSNDHLRKTYVLEGRPPGGAARRPDDDGAHQDPAAGSPPRLLSWPTKIRMGMELFRAPQAAQRRRRVRGGVRRGALRRRSRGLPGRTAALAASTAAIPESSA